MMTTVGTEWLIEASGCDAESLRDVERLRAVFERAISELGLRVLGQPLWHKFPCEGGVTGLAMLTESHLACHTYPEFGVATFNLYCCRERPAWAWEARLEEMLGATFVNVRSMSRTTDVPTPQGNLSPDAQPLSPDASPSSSDVLPSDALPSLSLPVSFESSPQTIANEGEA
jgi:S-adenosylmethionine decarboxylase